jgi:pyruvate dehydrogenase complex dehydrogenase (E1) component
MLQTTQKDLNKFRQEHEIYVDVQDLETYWVVTARIPKKEETLHRVHRVRKYITSRNDEGNVLILPNPEISENYLVENWGEMDSFDDFVEKALARILIDKEEADQGTGEGCGTSCG